MHKYPHTSCKRAPCERIYHAFAHFIVSAHVYDYCACNFHEIFLVVNYYLMILSLQFHKDLSFCWGGILLFVTMYNLEDKTIVFFQPELWSKVKQLFLKFWCNKYTLNLASRCGLNKTGWGGRRRKEASGNWYWILLWDTNLAMNRIYQLLIDLKFNGPGQELHTSTCITFLP